PFHSADCTRTPIYAEPLCNYNCVRSSATRNSRCAIDSTGCLLVEQAVAEVGHDGRGHADRRQKPFGRAEASLQVREGALQIAWVRTQQQITYDRRQVAPLRTAGADAERRLDIELGPVEQPFAHRVVVEYERSLDAEQIEQKRDCD